MSDEHVTDTLRKPRYWVQFALTDPEEPERVHEVGQGLATLKPNGEFEIRNIAHHQRNSVSLVTEDGVKFSKKSGYREELTIEALDGEVYRFGYCYGCWYRFIPQYSRRPLFFVRPLMDLYGGHGCIVGTCILMYRVGVVLYYGVGLMLSLGLFAALAWIALSGAGHEDLKERNLCGIGLLLLLHFSRQQQRAGAVSRSVN